MPELIDWSECDGPWVGPVQINETEWRCSLALSKAEPHTLRVIDPILSIRHNLIYKAQDTGDAEQDDVRGLPSA